MIDALKEAGNGPDDEAMKKALVFVSRCQNLESEYNTTPVAAKNPDGGFYYTPADGGESEADKLPNGGLRSYASMTYSGLKSMIYCGVKADDPRVKAATKWIQENYDLKTNPGIGPDGLYYYYHVFAKALAAMGSDTLHDAKGVKHDWRKELVDELAAAATAQRLVGQFQEPLAGRRSEPGDGLRAACAFLLPAEVIWLLGFSRCRLCGRIRLEPGWVAEWSIAAVLKTAVGESPPGVRIPPHPLVAAALELRPGTVAQRWFVESRSSTPHRIRRDLDLSGTPNMPCAFSPRGFDGRHDFVDGGGTRGEFGSFQPGNSLLPHVRERGQLLLTEPGGPPRESSPVQARPARIERRISAVSCPDWATPAGRRRPAHFLRRLPDAVFHIRVLP